MASTEETKKDLQEFSTGATRSSSAGRWHPHKFLSSIVLRRYCEYMHKNRVQKDGKLREPDNWKQGIPIENYAASFKRHADELWLLWEFPNKEHVNEVGEKLELENTLCALLFNVMGWMYELLMKKGGYRG